MGTNKADEIRAKILSSEDIGSKVIFVEIWGVDVEIRGLSSKKRAAIYRKARIVIPGPAGKDIIDVDSEILYPELVVECTYLPGSGEKIFKPGDIVEINNRAAVPVAQIADLAIELSGMGRKEIDEAKKESSSG